MGTEIERKFLVREGAWRPRSPGTRIRQGYIRSSDRCAVRVRIANRNASLTVKTVRNGITRLEFEYEIPLSDAEQMLNELCTHPLIEKTRYKESVGDRSWEVDVFHGDNEGLVLAEIEIPHEHESFSTPPWLGPEVSSDRRYYNSNLAEKPFTTWQT